jgi:rare lipoprotein A
MMASGERYDKNGLFCAHKKLPFGTKIRVVNKKNGKEVVVLVKDRGPFAQGRVIDLSNKAAEQLDMLRAGVVPVELWIGED